MQVGDTTKLKIVGMTSEDCNGYVRQALESVPQVENVTVDAGCGTAVVLHEGASPASLIQAVHDVGYGAYTLWDDDGDGKMTAPLSAARPAAITAPRATGHAEHTGTLRSRIAMGRRTGFISTVKMQSPKTAIEGTIMLPIKTIVCPTDFSEPSLQALDAACELAAHFGAELCLLHIVPFLPPFAADLVPVVVNMGSDRERMDGAMAELRKIVADRVPLGLASRCEVRMGDAAHEITVVADEMESALLLISTHGLTGWRHLAFGSVAETIVRLARRPVLTIHAKPAAPTALTAVAAIVGDELNVANHN